jgi:glycosyltransferase involved in cell wall biosynthesis
LPVPQRRERGKTREHSEDGEMIVPEVSVIVPTFNRRAMVCEAVASVFAQRTVRFELIVVDDGSTDGSTDQLTQIGAQLAVPAGITMRVIRNEENRGVAAARNRGIEAARAELIAFLDSDDLWAPNKLKHQVNFMYSHPICQFAQSGEVWMRDNCRVNPGRRHQKQEGDIFIESLRTCLISPSAVILRTAVLRAAGGFDETMLAAEDYDLWLRFLRRYPVGLLNLALVTRRAGHPGQLSAVVPALDRFRILALLKLLTDADAGSDLSLARRAAIHQVIGEKCRIYAQGLARRGSHRVAAAVREIGEAAAGGFEASSGNSTRALAAYRALLDQVCPANNRVVGASASLRSAAP